MKQTHIICIDLAKQGFQLYTREDKEGKTPWHYAKANAARFQLDATARNGT